MLNITQSQRLQQKLTPSQVQYLKLLQLPIIALEQRTKQELEENPLLEEDLETEEVQEEIPELREMLSDKEEEERGESAETIEPVAESTDMDDPVGQEIAEHEEDEHTWEDFAEEDDGCNQRTWYDRDDDRDYPTPANVSLKEHLIQQVHLLELEQRLIFLAEEIIWNVDEDGYLRRHLGEILHDVNHEHDTGITVEEAEKVLTKIQRLDPPGFAARNLRECLLVQVEVAEDHSTARIIAKKILQDCFDHFQKKHFEKIQQELHIDEGLLRKAIEYITRLNPKPGEGTFTPELNQVIPDFSVTREKDELIITLNDHGIPPLRLSKRYMEMYRQRRKDPETRRFIKQKMDSAKWFIQAISQRRQTMLAVMHAIVEKQRDWFENGPGYLKPLIYRDIADVIRMDISTISRTVNRKYVQTEWGVYELRYFFSEGIPTANGIEVSNTEVKNLIKRIIEEENPKKPLSDEAITAKLRERGFDIARRTVAKYREALGIPVSRLRVRF
ncbi:MAG: RNA polymerase factor sigma-54 [Bacteroidota bacterium]|nr:RNA polymerase factor sigma-54 [Bacteroidota bacterium]